MSDAVTAGRGALVDPPPTAHPRGDLADLRSRRAAPGAGGARPTVCQYRGLARLVEKSGLGVAAAHQEQMYARLGVRVATGIGSVLAPRRRDGRADFVHLNSVFPDAVLVALLARARGIPVVMHAHSTEQDFRDSFRGANRLSPLVGAWLRRAYACGDLVLTPTDYSRGLVEELLAAGGRPAPVDAAGRADAGVRAGRPGRAGGGEPGPAGRPRQRHRASRVPPVRAVSNGVDARFFSPDQGGRAGRRLRDRYGLPAERPVVVSVGHLFVRKGILDLVEVARRMPEVSFVWFGDTDPRLRTPEVAAALRGATPNLMLAGFVGPADLRDAYRGADAFCFLTHEETEGIVVLEALACGTRAVLRDIPLYHDWLGVPGAATLVADGPAFAARTVAALTGVLALTRADGAPLSVGPSERGLSGGVAGGGAIHARPVADTREAGLAAARAVDLETVALRLRDLLIEGGIWPSAREGEARAGAKAGAGARACAGRGAGAGGRACGRAGAQSRVRRSGSTETPAREQRPGAAADEDDH